MFSMQLLNIFYNHFFNENKWFFKQGYKSVNSVFIPVVTCIICKFFLKNFIFLGFVFILGTWWLSFFNFTVYDIIYILVLELISDYKQNKNEELTQSHKIQKGS